MIESWILAKLEPLRPAPLIILRDPQRLIQPGAHAVDGWGEEHGYTVLFCTGNLALREMVETVRGEPETKLLLVDRSRADARIPSSTPTWPRRPAHVGSKPFPCAITWSKPPAILAGLTCSTTASWHAVSWPICPPP